MSGEEQLKSLLSVHDADGQLTPEQYKKRYLFDFVIFGQARSGTHLIASLLNSHPEIACEGEVPITGFRDPDRGYSSVSWPIIEASAGCLPPKGRVRGCICHYIHQYQFVNQEGYRPGLWIHLVRNPRDNARSLLKRWDAVRKSDGATPPHYLTNKDRDARPQQAEPDEETLKKIIYETDTAARKNTEWLHYMQIKNQLRFMNLSYDLLTEGKDVDVVENIHTFNMLRFLDVETNCALIAKIVKQTKAEAEESEAKSN